VVRLSLSVSELDTNLRANVSDCVHVSFWTVDGGGTKVRNVTYSIGNNAMTAPSFPRLKSIGVQGAKVVGREQLIRISEINKGQTSTIKGAAGEISKDKAKATRETIIRRK
jgi:hypothetical protein